MPIHRFFPHLLFLVFLHSSLSSPVSAQSDSPALGTVLYKAPLTALLSQLAFPPSCSNGITGISSSFQSDILAACSSNTSSSLLSLNYANRSNFTLIISSLDLSFGAVTVDYIARETTSAVSDFFVSGPTASGVQRLGLDGVLLGSYGAEYGRCWGLCVIRELTDHQTLYLYTPVRKSATNGESAVLKLSASTGRLVQKIGLGLLVAPMTIAVTDWDGSVYVVDGSSPLYGGSSALLVFNHTGALLRSAPVYISSISGRESARAGLAVDWLFNVYLVDGRSLLVLHANNLTVRFNITDGLTAPVGVSIKANSVVIMDRVEGLVILQGLLSWTPYIPASPHSDDHTDADFFTFILAEQLAVVAGGVFAGLALLLCFIFTILRSVKARRQSEEVRRMNVEAARLLASLRLPNADAEERPFRLA